MLLYIPLWRSSWWWYSRQVDSWLRCYRRRAGLLISSSSAGVVHTTSVFLAESTCLFECYLFVLDLNNSFSQLIINNLWTLKLPTLAFKYPAILVNTVTNSWSSHNFKWFWCCQPNTDSFTEVVWIFVKFNKNIY